MISGREKMTCVGLVTNRACAMKSMTFSLMVLLNVVQVSEFFLEVYNIHGLCNGHLICFLSVHVVVWKVREHLP